MLALSLLLGAAVATAPALAAPITGENEPGPSGESADALDTPALQDPAALSPDDAAVGENSDAMVIEFSVMPSADDPTKMETVVILQRGAGRRICVNLKSSDVIVRSYRKRGDEPFAPAVPGDIRGLTSGDTGNLIGFNETNVFIRPHTIDDAFTSQDECFIAGEAEGCFLPEEGEDCDQRLEEGEVACVQGAISRAGCSVVDHASLARQLRILVTLNQPLGETPIITEADIAQAPEVAAPEEAGADLPAAPAAPAGPTDEAPPSGSGGGEEPVEEPVEDVVLVPDVVGMPVPVGIQVLTDARLTVGTVFVTRQFSALDDLFIKSAWAFTCVGPNPEDCDNPSSTIIDQGPDCVAGTEVPPFITVCNDVQGVLVLSTAIPEPPSLALFATGIGLLILMTWWRRRRLG
jgi:hypothetical protein